MRRTVRLVLLFRAALPPNVVGAGLVHTRSNCLSTLAANDRCFAAACTPFLDQSIVCPRHGILPPVFAIPDCCSQSATPPSPRPHPPAPSILPRPFVQSPLWSQFPMRIGRDPHRRLRSRASQGCAVYPALRTAISDFLNYSGLDRPRIGARRESPFVRHDGL